MTKEEKDLEDALEEEFNWIEMDEVENKVSSNKCSYPTLENDTSVDSFATKDFSLTNSNQTEEEDSNIDINSINEESTWDPKRSLVLK